MGCFLAFAVAGCDDGEQVLDSSTSPTTTALSTETPAQTANQTPVVYISLPGAELGMEIDESSDMLPRWGTVVVGHVTGILEPYYERQGTSLIMDDCSTLATDSPKGRALAAICRTLAPEETPEPVGRNFTTYSVQVVESVYGDATVGQEVAVGQVGGVLEGVPHVDPDDPQLMEVGETYLFFLCCGPSDDPAHEYHAPPFGRFRVADDGTLVAQTNDYPLHPLVMQLPGLTVEEAVALVQAALSGPSASAEPTASSGSSASPVASGSPDPTVQ